MTEIEYHEPEAEESYFVSMTDIMVGMLFVFIILLMYFVFRIQNTSEPTVPLSEFRAVVIDRDNLSSSLTWSITRIYVLEKEIERLNEIPLRDTSSRPILREKTF